MAGELINTELNGINQEGEVVEKQRFGPQHARRPATRQERIKGVIYPTPESRRFRGDPQARRGVLPGGSCPTFADNSEVDRLPGAPR